jgi:pimeloyl-ACP methyl ester carboxylesterase
VPFTVVHGVRTRYRETGAGRPGTPLVFVHGAAGSSVTWLGLLRQLGRTRRCLALDLPGHGQTGLLPEGARAVSIEAYRDFLGAFCAAACVPRAVLVGHSMGSAVALEAALAWPERVAGLVLVGAAARLPVAPAIFEAIDKHFDKLPELLAEVGFSPHTPKELALRYARAGVHATQEIVRADFEACTRWDARERIGRIVTPTVVIAGDDDLLTPPKWGRWLGEHIPGTRVVAVPRAGHMAQLEAPDATAVAAAHVLQGSC